MKTSQGHLTHSCGKGDFWKEMTEINRTRVEGGGRMCEEKGIESTKDQEGSNNLSIEGRRAIELG